MGKKEFIESTNRGFKGIWIPANVWLCDELTVNEMLFLVEIDSLDNENGCFASNEYFSKFFELSKNRCGEIIKGLEQKGMITTRYVYKEGTKYIEKRIINISDKFKDIVYGRSSDYIVDEQKDDSREVESVSREIEQHSRKVDDGYSKNTEDNNISFNNTVSNKKNNTTNKKDIKGIVSAYASPDSELYNCLIDFLDMRKANKKPITTERAMNILLKKLDGLAADEYTKIKIVEQSIESSWSTFYELKQQGAYKQTPSREKTKEAEVAALNAWINS